MKTVNDIESIIDSGMENLEIFKLDRDTALLNLFEYHEKTCKQFASELASDDIRKRHSARKSLQNLPAVLEIITEKILQKNTSNKKIMKINLLILKI
ncbi:hypothetical protein [Ammoniphilus resinae]|uniref:Uncharacterized protein n=1 Tax=Ammoniphilus resinae TaxID=861532 RepID=A0ABS4GNX5_9BACL|nr:hypothetical protein [Ammoniphilus resinae]MBP1931969.1 hypothetical protein [Ammoniphilus resinae]